MSLVPSWRLLILFMERVTNLEPMLSSHCTTLFWCIPLFRDLLFYFGELSM